MEKTTTYFVGIVFVVLILMFAIVKNPDIRDTIKEKVIGEPKEKLPATLNVTIKFRDQYGNPYSKDALIILIAELGEEIRLSERSSIISVLNTSKPYNIIVDEGYNSAFIYPYEGTITITKEQQYVTIERRALIQLAPILSGMKIIENKDLVELVSGKNQTAIAIVSIIGPGVVKCPEIEFKSDNFKGEIVVWPSGVSGFELDKDLMSPIEFNKNYSLGEELDKRDFLYLQMKIKQPRGEFKLVVSECNNLQTPSVKRFAFT